MTYDFLLVGAGLYNAVLAERLKASGANVLVIERRNHVGGNCYTRLKDGIVIHEYGAHIFRTNDADIWDYVNGFTEFENFINSPIAKYGRETYNLPFNMNTFSKLWDVNSPDEAKIKIASQTTPNDNPKNLEEYVLSVVGTDIYEKLIKEYTEKQWGKKCSELPVDIMKRIPIRFTYDNNYYSNVMFQGVPILGYTTMIEHMLKDIPVLLGVEGKRFISCNPTIAEKIVYTGCIDEYYDKMFGALEYRSLKFRTEKFDTENYQGVAVVNHTSKDVPYTRTIEHRHFSRVCNSGITYVTYETPVKFTDGLEPFYPINDTNNNNLLKKYQEYAYDKDRNIIFAGRLGSYRYTDMTDTISDAIKMSKEII